MKWIAINQDQERRPISHDQASRGRDQGRERESRLLLADLVLGRLVLDDLVLGRVVLDDLVLSRLALAD